MPTTRLKLPFAFKKRYSLLAALILLGSYVIEARSDRPILASVPPVNVETNELEALTCQATVTDGDTIRIGKSRIRFFGIDAPEKKQYCTQNKQLYACGIAAKEALGKLIGGQNVQYRQQPESHVIFTAELMANVSLETLV